MTALVFKKLLCSLVYLIFDKLHPCICLRELFLHSSLLPLTKRAVWMVILQMFFCAVFMYSQKLHILIYVIKTDTVYALCSTLIYRPNSLWHLGHSIIKSAGSLSVTLLNSEGFETFVILTGTKTHLLIGQVLVLTKDIFRRNIVRKYDLHSRVYRLLVKCPTSSRCRRDRSSALSYRRRCIYSHL